MKPVDPARMTSFRCAGPAWVIGWAVAVFLPSAIIAFAGISAHSRPIGSGFAHLGATTFAVADEVGPAAKLLLGALLAGLWFGAARLRPTTPVQAVAANVAAGVAAIIGALLLVPADYSRGFGVGLTGARLDPHTLPVYLLGGIAAGLAFTQSLRRCARR